MELFFLEIVIIIGFIYTIYSTYKSNPCKYADHKWVKEAGKPTRCKRCGRRQSTYPF